MPSAVAWRTLTVAVFLGLVGETLFYDAPWGVNVILWTLFLVVCGVVTAIGSGGTPARTAIGLGIGALVFAGGFAMNDSWGMAVVNALGLGTCVALLTTHVWDPKQARLNILDATIGILSTWFAYLVDALTLVFSEVKWNGLGERGEMKKAAPVIRGLLVATPIVLVFGALFASADAVFRSFVFRPLEFDPTTAFGHIGLFVVFFLLSAGIVRRTVIGRPIADCTMPDSQSQPEKHATETLVVLGALNILFASFVAVQFRYLFGGQGALESNTGLSYSTYAREGFFQLVAVVALSVPVLAAAAKLAGSTRLYRWFAVAMVVQLGIVTISAFQRMGLYVSYAGLSELRVYTSAFMGWLVVVIVSVNFKALTGRVGNAVPWSVAAALVIGVGLNALRPGVFIAESNVRIAKDPSLVDVFYLTTLGADAAPAIARILPGLKGDQKSEAARWLQQVSDDGRADWRGTNLSRVQAVAAVASRSDEIAKATADDTVTRR